jgi:Coenzyme PQQ synthesis protein D (PqqD)
MSLQISDAVIWHESAGSVSLYDAKAGDFHTLNETGSKIWALVASEGEWKPILSKLVDEFAGNDTAVTIQIVTDGKAFLGSMIERGWIEERLV